MVDYSGGNAVERLFYFITGYGHAGVVVFFVLSGFLVGRKVRELAADPAPDVRGYLVDRFSRIFTVAWPAVLLSLAVLIVVCAARPHAPFVSDAGWSASLSKPLGADLKVGRWLGMTVLLNELVTATPQVNGPLWSLAYEWTYYLGALALVLITRRRFSWALPYGIALIALGALNPTILSGAVVWSLGVVASVASDRGWLKGKVLLLALLAIAGAALAVWRLQQFSDIILGASVALMISHVAWRSWSFLSATGEKFAAFSYTLYATHFPVCVLLLLPLDSRLSYGPAGVAAVVGGVILSVMFAWALAQITEARTREVRRTLLAFGRPRLAAA